MPTRQLLMAAIALVATGLFSVSCSNDQSGSILGTSNGLTKERPHIITVEEPPGLVILPCKITPVNVFASGGGLPFDLACENEDNADLHIDTYEYNADSCLVGLAGWVDYTDTGHRYTFTAKTNGCEQDGGLIKVCSTEWTRCRTVKMPRLYYISHRTREFK